MYLKFLTTLPHLYTIDGSCINATSTFMSIKIWLRFAAAFIACCRFICITLRREVDKSMEIGWGWLKLAKKRFYCVFRYRLIALLSSGHSLLPAAWLPSESLTFTGLPRQLTQRNRSLLVTVHPFLRWFPLHFPQVSFVTYFWHLKHLLTSRFGSGSTTKHRLSGRNTSPRWISMSLTVFELKRILMRPEIPSLLLNIVRIDTSGVPPMAGFLNRGASNRSSLVLLKSTNLPQPDTAFSVYCCYAGFSLHTPMQTGYLLLCLCSSHPLRSW